jgi:hypothetical protein
MSIKRRENAPTSARFDGCLATSPDEVPVVRFVLPDRTVSYVASTLSRWELSLESGETLTIDAGDDKVVVTGSGLAAVRDALDSGQLQELRSLKRKRTGDEPWIVEMTIERQ